MSSSYTPYSDVYGDPRGEQRDKSWDQRMQNQYPEDVNGVRRSDLIRPYESRRHREQMHNYSSRDSGNRNQRDDDRESSNRSNRRPRPRRNSSYSRDDDEWNDDSSGQSQQQRQQQRRSRSQDGTQVAEKKSAKKSLWPKRAPDRTDVHSQDAIHRGLGYFDYRSFNGLLAGATGAGFGAITARSIGPNHYKPGQKRETNWQMIAGAVAGGLAANAIESRFRAKNEEGEEGEGEGSEG